MNTLEVINYGSTALVLVLMLSLPAVMTALIVGLVVGLLQALTQIQDQSVPFGIKLVAVLVVISLTIKWLGVELHGFTVQIMDIIPTIKP